MDILYPWGIEINDSLTTTLIGKTQVVGLAVAAFCFIINLGYNYMRTGYSNLVGQKEPFPDMMELGRCFVIVIALTVYGPCVQTITGGLEMINETTSLTADAKNWASDWQKYREEEMKNMDENQSAIESAIEDGGELGAAAEHEKGAIEKAYEWVVSVAQDGIQKAAGIIDMFHPIKIVEHVINAIFFLLAGMIGIIINGFCVIMIKIMAIFGPLAFGFSILPVFRRQLATWFGTLCSLGVTISVVNIINVIFMNMFFKIQSQASFFEMIRDYNKTCAMDVILVFCMCSSFWIASKIVGHRDSASVLSKAITTLTAAAMVVATGGAGSGAVAGGGVAKAASAGASVIKGEK